MDVSMLSHYWLLKHKIYSFSRMVDMIAKRLPKEPHRMMDSRGPMDKKARKAVGAFHPAMYSSGRVDKDGPYKNNYLSPNPMGIGLIK